MVRAVWGITYQDEAHIIGDGIELQSELEAIQIRNRNRKRDWEHHLELNRHQNRKRNT